jgi:hypothetical protein
VIALSALASNAPISGQSIAPDLSTERAWSENGTRLTFQLRQGVK